MYQLSDKLELNQKLALREQNYGADYDVPQYRERFP